MGFFLIVKDNIDFIFCFKCNDIGSNSCNIEILGEMLKLNNFCYVKGYEFDYIVLDPFDNYKFRDESMIVCRYNFNDLDFVLKILNSRLTPFEECELCLLNQSSL
jgi:hypothetical protein